MQENVTDNQLTKKDMNRQKIALIKSSKENDLIKDIFIHLFFYHLQ